MPHSTRLHSRLHTALENELLLYVVNNLSWKADDESEDFVIARALDEITCMKMTRIEGDEIHGERKFRITLKLIKSGLVEIDNGLLEGDAYQPISSTSSTR